VGENKLYKKVIVLLMLVLLSGCSVKSVSNSSLEENVKYAIGQDISLANINNKGFKYYLPKDVNVLLDEEYNQVLISEDTRMYMYVDVVSYYNEKEVNYKNSGEAYKYILLNSKEKSGYLKIFKYNNKFLVEMLYNYGIIEMVVDEDKLDKLIINASYILSSIQYNKSVIEKFVGEGVFESKEYVYEIFGPTDEEKNLLDVIKQNNNSNETEMID
jgi:hypothetical protein